ncbi:hypothetical protein MNBD_BACTEROID06-479 [hydrothermal vent metagenome]|uniref:Uncharacterized protein n=1 Tax=hydrothermal vent metagenome TaxID=652676 RepID=A0A3B0UFQ2_9ZZZZ
MNMAAFYAKHKKTGFYLREKIIFSGSEKKTFLYTIDETNTLRMSLNIPFTNGIKIEPICPDNNL